MRFQEYATSSDPNLQLRSTLLTETHIRDWLNREVAIPPHIKVSLLNTEAIAALDLSSYPRKNFLDTKAIFTISLDNACESACARLIEVFGPTSSSAVHQSSTLLDWEPTAREWPFVTVHLVTESLNDLKKGVMDFETESVLECLAYHFPNSNHDELLTWHQNDLIPLNAEHDLAPGLAEILVQQSQSPSQEILQLPSSLDL